MPDREKVIRGLKCCTKEPLVLACHECPYHVSDDGTHNNCDQLEKDALELLTGQEPERPEKIETGKMKICALVSEIGTDGRFTSFPGGMTFSWNDSSTNKREEMIMLFGEWIRFSKEIAEAVARFEMEG